MIKTGVAYPYSSLVIDLRQTVIAEAQKSSLVDSWFLPFHLLEVEKIANDLCDQYPQADREVIALAVWFHDLGRFRGHDKDHDLYGAEEVRKILTQKKCPATKINLVYEACRAHRCKDIIPQSLEAKIVASADAMSHFTHSFYLRAFCHLQSQAGFDEARRIIGQKLKRDFHDKIFFDQAREIVKPQYEALKLIIESVPY